MSVKVKDVCPAENMNIIVTFENNVTKKYDVTQLFSQFDWYRALEDQSIFSRVRVDAGGYGVSWNEDIDISEDEL